MGSTAIEFLPFITPLDNPTVSDVEFSTAADDWNNTLSRLLRYNTTAFWSELLVNPSLSEFINAFLGQYASFRGDKDSAWVMELDQVVRRVFMIYRRLSETMDSPEAATAVAQLTLPSGGNTPGSALLEQGLVSTSVLLDFAGIFGSSDPDSVGKIVSLVLQHTPALINDFRASTGTVVQIIRGVQKKFEKVINGGSSAGKGKGKGKGKGISPSMSPEPASSSPFDEAKATEAVQYGSALLDIAHALEALSSVSSVLAAELRLHAPFLQSLLGCYNYTLPVLSQLASVAKEIDSERITAVLDHLRLKMLAIVNNMLDGICNEKHPDKNIALSDDAASAITDEICGVLMSIFEQSPMENSIVPMESAPMIVDLEIHFNISDKLTDLVQDVYGGENDRMHNLATMLRNLRDFNQATRDYVDDHNMKKSEHLARQMSNSYLVKDRNRSNTTITPDTTQHDIGTGHVSMDDEEEYVKRTLLISQLQDLFPDLGDGFLEACLKAMRDDPEAVTMSLLEENLPAHLASMDRSTARMPPRRAETAPTSMALIKAEPVEPVTDLLASRRNIFDGDEFDVFSGKAVDRSKVSRGKRVPVNAEVVLDDKSFVSQHKSAILQAVEAMYDDEYDDTYDSMGINNTGADFKLVDDIDANADDSATGAAAARAQMQLDPSIEHEEALITLYTAQKEVFNRSSEARRSKKRQELRSLTKMTDEQIEGWAIMFDRNPRKAVIIQKYEFSGQQQAIDKVEPKDKRRGGRPIVDKSTAQAKQHESGAPSPGQANSSSQNGAPQKSSSQKPKGPSGQHQQQKKPSDEQKKAAANDKAKNERQKASKANHNRRNQHAKKMASMNPV
ncbi:hypothetical protein BGZ94_008821 [Podila epigama]|nr:hypothetical protein BGZ94_008821 [Podila epigama]